MKPQNLIMLAVAIGCGLISMLGIRQLLNREDTRKEPVREIVAARSDIPAGIPLNESNVHFVSVPETLVPEFAVTSLEELEQRSLKRPANAGEWILTNKLGDPGQFGVITKLPEGMAAATIPADETTTHSGMLTPGNRVDLLLTYRPEGGGNGNQKTITVLEFVEVFAIDKHIYGSEMAQDGKAKNLTLLVTPLQAKAVALASNLGKLSTTLRRPGDAPPADPKGLHEDFTAEFLEEMQDKSNGDKPGVAGVDDDSAGAYQPQKPIGTSISDLVDAELEQTEQVMSGEQSEGTEEGPHWLLEIHERDKVRVERVKLTDPAEVGTKI
jgi:pilus assembly protein CpaB